VIELVVTDLDGTFWDPDLTLPASHRRACDELRQAGVTVLAATARRRLGVAAAFVAAGIDLPAVLLNGALGVDFVTGTTFHAATFSDAQASSTLATFRDHGLEPTLYVDDPSFDAVLAPVPSTCAAHAAYLAPLARVGDLDEAAASGRVLGFGLLGLPGDVLGPVADDLAATGAATVLFEDPFYGGSGINVGPPSVSKWTGVLAFCRERGIDPGAVLAVGDGDNDVEMLREAAVAVAVRGGTPACTAGADHLIDPPGAGGWSEVAALVRSG
jgi:hydroxymethylpyrimidine pyrophosphatase-like HAD family hydrolase